MLSIFCTALDTGSSSEKENDSPRKHETLQRDSED